MPCDELDTRLSLGVVTQWLLVDRRSVAIPERGRYQIRPPSVTPPAAGGLTRKEKRENHPLRSLCLFLMECYQAGPCADQSLRPLKRAK